MNSDLQLIISLTYRITGLQIFYQETSGMQVQQESSRIKMMTIEIISLILLIDMEIHQVFATFYRCPKLTGKAQ